MLRVPEIPAAYGAMDSALFVDGDVPSAHACRELARSANRLIARGEVILNHMWVVATSAEEQAVRGALYGYAPIGAWLEIMPPTLYPVFPGLNLAKLFTRSLIASGANVYLQITTNAVPFTSAIDTSKANQLKLTYSGTPGAWGNDTKDNVPIAPINGFETIGVYVIGTPGNATTSSGTVSGTIEEVNGRELRDTSAAFDNTAPTVADGGIVVRFEDSSGRELLHPREVTSTVAGDATRFIVAGPEFTTQEVRTITSATGGYKFYDLPKFRLAYLSLYAKDRTG